MFRVYLAVRLENYTCEELIECFSKLCCFCWLFLCLSVCLSLSFAANYTGPALFFSPSFLLFCKASKEMFTSSGVSPFFLFCWPRGIHHHRSLLGLPVVFSPLPRLFTMSITGCNYRMVRLFCHLQRSAYSMDLVFFSKSSTFFLAIFLSIAWIWTTMTVSFFLPGRWRRVSKLTAK